MKRAQTAKSHLVRNAATKQLAIIYLWHREEITIMKSGGGGGGKVGGCY